MPIALDRSHPESGKFRDSRKPLRVARLSLPVIALLLPNPAFAQTCDVNMTAVERRIADLEGNHSLVLSDIGCEAPTKKAHQLMCDAALDPQSNLWRMGRLDDLAWVYAYENATGTRIDQENPPRDPDFIAKRDACTDEACLCAALREHTDDSLGGTSPYYKP
ncbi:MAG: hypothetical protein J0H31_10450 [Alphaproteobacteria bacterium]|nr:hypothetical protein [Alphaproteobacteria bacterium]